ncbi:hypothetical protein ATE76_24370 [Sphingopyxis sp. H093]|nr:hypothetical protein ATE76_24370 [Sphingopyxis sp. H093]KTE24917.1 hypothetical protein ATE75_17605 [Sphingopyxis sp. H080]
MPRSADALHRDADELFQPHALRKDVASFPFVIPDLIRDPAFVRHRLASISSGTPDQVRGDDE